MSRPPDVVAVAFVPMTPLLFRHLSGAADPFAELRSAAVEAVGEACEGAEQVLVLCPVGGREAPGEWHDPAGRLRLGGPLSQQVAAHVLELAGVALPASYVATGGAPPDLVGRTALLVMGDGAAARSQAAPGHLDERSFAFDDSVADLLAAGDGVGLAGLDQALAAELLATGRHSWPALATYAPKASDADLRWRGDPLGLSWFVALWRV